MRNELRWSEAPWYNYLELAASFDSSTDLILIYFSRFTFLITEIILPSSPQFCSMGMETSNLSF